MRKKKKKNSKHVDIKRLTSLNGKSTYSGLRSNIFDTHELTIKTDAQICSNRNEAYLGRRNLPYISAKRNRYVSKPLNSRIILNESMK